MTFPSRCRCCYSCPNYYKIKGLCIRHILTNTLCILYVNALLSRVL
jgi:hypothetical protein